MLLLGFYCGNKGLMAWLNHTTKRDKISYNANTIVMGNGLIGIDVRE